MLNSNNRSTAQSNADINDFAFVEMAPQIKQNNGLNRNL